MPIECNCKNSKMPSKRMKIAEKFENYEDVNLLSILKPMYYLLTIFGLFPYGVDYKKTTQEIVIISKSIFRNTVCGLGNLLVIFVFYSAHLVHLCNSDDQDYLIENDTAKINYIIEMTILLMFSISAYVCAAIFKADYMRILNTISLVLNEMPKDLIIKSLLRLRSVVRFLVFVYIVLQTILYTCVESTAGDTLWKFSLVQFSFLFPQLIQTIFLSFHYTLIQMLVEVLKNINEQLMFSLKQSKDDFEYHGRVFYKVDSLSAVMTVRQMERRYTKVFEAKKWINAAFQNPILIITLNGFHTIVSESYNLYNLIINKAPELHSVIASSSWLAGQITKIYILALSGASLNLEEHRLRQSLLNIPITDKMDIRMLMEIQHFSTLMDVHGTKLTVYGFFTLDATLLFNMIATAATYLIILVQFDVADDAE